MTTPLKRDKSVAVSRPWPSQLDYQGVIEFPTLCFSDPQLQRCQVVDRTPFGMPLPFTGQFTNVYRMAQQDDTVFAVRLFLRDDPGRAHHWGVLKAYFDGLPQMPLCLSSVEYQETGFWLRGLSYPLVKMPWRQGVPLNIYIEKNLYDAEVLRRLAQKWRQVIEELGTVGFVHGDLQHGNVLVDESGTIYHIDYDASYVRALANTANREAGHPSYQHPGRSPVHYGPLLDRFSALVIYTAIRALAVAPQLWFRLDDGDNLLFQREDFSNPFNSRAFTVLTEALRHYPAERELVSLLRQACQSSPTSVPTLERL